jgi:hypothetical protein
MLAWTVPILPLVWCAACNLDWFFSPTSRRGGVHASRTVVTRWFPRSHGCCFRHTRWIPCVWIILHSLWAAGLG